MIDYQVSGFTALAVAIHDWVWRALGPTVATDPRERAKRVLEEAIELAQAEGIPDREAIAVVNHVYRRPVGEPSQEAAGVGFCWIAYCEAKNFQGISLVIKELERIDTPEMIENVRLKHDMKVQAGISMQRDHT